MLKKLRKKKTAKRIWIVLTVLILPAFLFWGFGSFMRGREEAAYVGIISGRRVSLQDYKDALDAARNQAIIQLGDNLSEIEEKINLEAMAWDRLVLLAQAKKQKISASDREVMDLIWSYPFFQKKGSFDNQIYSQMLQYVFRTQPRIFEEQLRQSLMLSKLYKKITGDISLTDDEIKEEYRKLNEQISLYYIAGIPADFLKDISPSEEEIRDYFMANSIQFKEPVSFNIEYVSMDSDGNEAAVKEKINAMVLRLNKKENFAKVAAESGIQVKETGLFRQIDSIPGIGWSEQISNLISKLRIGEFAPPVYLDKHYYILRLKDRKESYIPDFQSIKDRVKEALIKERTNKIVRKKMEDCLYELKAAYKTNPKSIDFPKTARAYGLKSDSTQPFKFGSYIEGIGASDIFFTAALGLKEDGISGIIEMPSAFYIVKVKSRVPIDEKKFAEEKPELAEKLLAQKKEEYFGRFLWELKRNTQLIRSY